MGNHPKFLDPHPPHPPPIIIIINIISYNGLFCLIRKNWIFRLGNVECLHFPTSTWEMFYNILRLSFKIIRFATCSDPVCQNVLIIKSPLSFALKSIIFWAIYGGGERNFCYGKSVVFIEIFWRIILISGRGAENLYPLYPAYKTLHSW